MLTDLERDVLAAEQMPDAIALVSAVRSSPADVTDVLAGKDHQQLLALAVCLAALVPDDVPPSQLLAWLDPKAAAKGEVRSWSDEQVKHAHATFTAHRIATNRGQQVAPLPWDVTAGEREYQRRAGERKRARRLQVAS